MASEQPANGDDPRPANGRGRVGRGEVGGSGATVQSLDRALAILDTVLFSKDRLGLTEISSQVGLPKSTTHRLLSTLERRGFVARSRATGRYRPGLKTLPGLGLGPHAHRVLERLADRSGETANLGTLVGRNVVYVDRADSPHALRWQLGVGSQVPAHCSGLGKAILAFQPPEAVDEMVPASMEARTARTIHDRAVLLSALAEIRERRYSVDDEEFIEGVRCVAAPVWGADGEVGGAISIAGPAFRLTPQAMERHIPALLEAAAEVSALIGGTVPRHLNGAAR